MGKGGAKAKGEEKQKPPQQPVSDDESDDDEGKSLLLRPPVPSLTCIYEVMLGVYARPGANTQIMSHIGLTSKWCDPSNAAVIGGWVG